MLSCLMLLAPSANRVYTQATPRLAAAELAVTAPFASAVAPTNVAGVGYLAFEAATLGDAQLAVLAMQSTMLGLFVREGDLLRPVELPSLLVMDDDLVSIPKYQGKTNELFTRLLLNVTLAQLSSQRAGQRLQVLDPLAGRGTTLLTAWTLGLDGFGVESDVRAFEQLAAYLKTYLRRKRLKHTAAVTPVRREGQLRGQRLDATVRLGETTEGAPTLELAVLTGDTINSARLFGKKKFDAIVTDAPYGVVHGAGHQGRRDRSPADLLRTAIPVWAGQLKGGGALGISWNSYGLTREELADILTDAGLTVCAGPEWLGFGHRVDQAIHRDLMVAARPRRDEA